MYLIESGEDHDTGDEDVEARNPCEWLHRPAVVTCCVCSSVAELTEYTRVSGSQCQAFRLCSDPACMVALDRFCAAQSRCCA
jgi:hypothetical protein